MNFRYLATGESMINLSYSFRLGHSTVCQIISLTLNVLWNVLKDDFIKPTRENWEQIAHDFEIK